LMKDIDTAGVETYSNYRKGTSEYFVIEACEYKRSFLNVQPEILVITNIEADHLDYYKDLADIQNAFTELAHKVPATGAIICNPNHPHLVPVLEGVTAQIIDYTQVDDTVFDLKVPGKHNRENAQCAYAVAEFCGMKKEDILKGLALFAGTWRRFEYKKILANGALLYDDYAHHPTEIRATLQAMREKFPDKEIMVAFHPHLYSRTKQLLADFVDALALADDIVLAPIFAARETFDPSVSSMLLAETLSEKGASAVALENFEQIAGYIADYGNSDTVVVTMGAGDIYKVGDMLA